MYHANRLAMKLNRFARLSEPEVQAIAQLSGETISKEAGVDILRQGDKPETVTLILEGMACRYKVTEAGNRQIVGLMVPGDLCYLHAFILNEMDQSVAALTPITLTHIAKSKLLDLFDREPRITRALWWSTLVDEGTLREWVMNIASARHTKRWLIC
jgi:CRP-like cAMP-binding protein